MNESDYEKKLLPLIESFLKKDMTPLEFKNFAQIIGKDLDKPQYKSIDMFTDKELGWAKYWIEEMDFYGVDEVINNKFDFRKFYRDRLKL